MDCVYLPAETKVVYLWLARTCQSVSKDSRLHYRTSRGRGTANRGVSISLVTFESWHRRRSSTINTLPPRCPPRCGALAVANLNGGPYWGRASGTLLAALCCRNMGLGRFGGCRI